MAFAVYIAFPTSNNLNVKPYSFFKFAFIKQSLNQTLKVVEFVTSFLHFVRFSELEVTLLNLFKDVEKKSNYYKII